MWYLDCRYSLPALLTDGNNKDQNKEKNGDNNREGGEGRNIYQITIDNIPGDLAGEDYAKPERLPQGMEDDTSEGRITTILKECTFSHEGKEIQSPFTEVVVNTKTMSPRTHTCSGHCLGVHYHLCKGGLYFLPLM